eukprot:scaffold163968_cov38-Prasinocladus_malaysianus.AAC.1
MQSGQRSLDCDFVARLGQKVVVDARVVEVVHDGRQEDRQQVQRLAVAEGGEPAVRQSLGVDCLEHVGDVYAVVVGVVVHAVLHAVWQSMRCVTSQIKVAAFDYLRKLTLLQS